MDTFVVKYKLKTNKDEVYTSFINATSLDHANEILNKDIEISTFEIMPTEDEVIA